MNSGGTASLGRELAAARSLKITEEVWNRPRLSNKWVRVASHSPEYRPALSKVCLERRESAGCERWASAVLAQPP